MKNLLEHDKVNWTMKSDLNYFATSLCLSMTVVPPLRLNSYTL